MKNFIFIMCLALFLAACQSPAPPEAQDDTPEPGPETSEVAAPEPEPEVATGMPIPGSLSGEVLYYLLAAEIALQRNRMDVAVEGYSKAAQSTNDLRIIERAARIAVYARDVPRALQAAEQWVQLAPHNAEARQLLAALLVRAGRVDEAVPHFEALLDLSQGDDGEQQPYMLITSLLSKEDDQQVALETMQKLVADRGANPDAQYALAHLAMMVDDLEQAEAAIERALAGRPDWSEAHLLRANILHRQGKSQRLLRLLRAELEERPEDVALRLFLARKLVDEEQFDAARREFDAVLERQPGHADALYAQGLLALQMEDFEQAETSFKQLIAQKLRVNEARYYLGQTAEMQEAYELALDYYTMIDEGQHYVDARVRAAGILVERDGLAAARKHLQATRTEEMDEQLRLYLAEGELLHNAGEHEQAYQLYTTALEQMPDNSRLLYVRALTAEKLDRLEQTIADLQRIIDNEPNNAEALNALGYTLVDATDRVDEGFELIRRAYKVNPDEPAIIDSMGWAYYRQGEYDKALKYLQRAFNKLNDGEIAAHLGEVLWVTGRRDDAREVWEEALREAPEHQLLRNVIERLTR
ncbi:tetratricopeptide repeat protein [Thiohalophilus thiocyanatoxydans]|uniref:Flp pilus assembly protein TadD n=1 Tax=Thiohalophilus thiocyanatoxydans TaxID=381308 RepID=A0A4R8IEQ9_9GAMM|nr:tetratricopeptide repeat protein [Thiohalophilus thiocyanatoxydans]TDX97756.1 Flp pilus assembly protein TadD [Thiohalophilus thiocyanatoxydans]